MIRKNRNHKLRTNPWHREEDPHNNHKTPGKQTKQIILFTMINRDSVYPPKIDIKLNSVVMKSNSI